MTRLVDPAGAPGQQERVLTVAQVRIRDEYTDVFFFETTRIYRWPGANPDYASGLRVLREASVAGTPVRVRFVEVNGNVIESVRAET